MKSRKFLIEKQRLILIEAGMKAFAKPSAIAMNTSREQDICTLAAPPIPKSTMVKIQIMKTQIMKTQIMKIHIMKTQIRRTQRRTQRTKTQRTKILHRGIAHFVLRDNRLLVTQAVGDLHQQTSRPRALRPAHRAHETLPYYADNSNRRVFLTVQLVEVYRETRG